MKRLYPLSIASLSSISDRTFSDVSAGGDVSAFATAMRSIIALFRMSVLMGIECVRDSDA